MTTWNAHAKVNLALAVGPPLPPRGYHPIASWFACIGLHDEVSIESVKSGSVSSWTIEWAADAPRQSPIDWPVEKDLAVRAHRLLEATAGRPLPVRGVVRKRVPVGAGLGGGSADCAAAMMGINDLFSLGLSRAKLRELAMTLGSDIAFFIDDDCGPDAPARPALVTGFGEHIERVNGVRGHAVLLFPPFGCPTGPVYQAFDRMGPGPLREREVRELAAQTPISSGHLFNDLERAAAAVEPRLADVLARLRTGPAALPVLVHVTGSGSTLFALAESQREAESLAVAARQADSALVALSTTLV